MNLQCQTKHANFWKFRSLGWAARFGELFFFCVYLIFQPEFSFILLWGHHHHFGSQCWWTALSTETSTHQAHGRAPKRINKSTWPLGQSHAWALEARSWREEWKCCSWKEEKRKKNPQPALPWRNDFFSQIPPRMSALMLRATSWPPRRSLLLEYNKHTKLNRCTLSCFLLTLINLSSGALLGVLSLRLSFGGLSPWQLQT